MAWQVIDGETVLLDIDGQELLGLNAVGGRVWELCDGERTVDQLVAHITSEFAAPAETVAADVARFIGELEAMGALSWK